MFCWQFIWDEEQPCFPASLIWSVAKKETRVYSLLHVYIGTCMPSVCDDNEIFVYSCVVLRETIAKALVWTEIVFILKPVGRFSPLSSSTDATKRFNILTLQYLLCERRAMFSHLPSQCIKLEQPCLWSQPTLCNLKAPCLFIKRY